MKIRNSALNWLIARAASWLLRLLFLTVRTDHRTVVPGATPYCPVNGTQRYCFPMWHDAILTAVFSMKTYKLGGLVSLHQDGSYLTHALRLAGITPVRGSSSRGGAAAVRQLLDKSDLHLCITPDGPRGPRRLMKEGAVFLSSRTGRPLVPTVVTGTSMWHIPGNWSDMLVPRPFSRAVLLCGRPVEVPADCDRETVREIMERFQNEMNRMQAIGDAVMRGDDSAFELAGIPGAWPNGYRHGNEAQRTDDSANGSASAPQSHNAAA